MRARPSVSRHYVLSFLPALPLLLSPALCQTVVPLHSCLATSLKLVGRQQRCGAQGAYGAGPIKVPTAPCPTCDPECTKWSGSPSGKSFGLINTTMIPSLRCGPLARQTGLHLHVEECKSHSISSKCMEGCLQACNFYGCPILLQARQLYDVRML